MASSLSNPDAAANPSGPVTSGPSRISNASHPSYKEGQLAWDGGKLGDEDIVAITSIDGREDERVIWSLAPIDTEPNPSQPPFKLQSTLATSLPPDFLEKYLIQVLPDHLSAKTHDIYVLISTRSGTGLAPDFYKQVLQPLLGAVGLAQSRYHVSQTENTESVKDFAHTTLLDGANNGRKQTVLLLSGDGGIVDTINGLLETGHQTRYFFFTIEFSFPLILYLQYLCQASNIPASTRYRKRSFPFCPPSI